MNEILVLKGAFDKRANETNPSMHSLSAGKIIRSSHIKVLYGELEEILNFWKDNDLIDGALISVHYKDIVAKSNRLCRILVEDRNDSSKGIRGARFENIVEEESGRTKKRHVFTYYVNFEAIEKAIDELVIVADIIDEYYGGAISSELVYSFTAKKGFPYQERIGVTAFKDVIFDAYHVAEFDLDVNVKKYNGNAIISLYDTGIPVKELLQRLGINVLHNRVIDDRTVMLDPYEIDVLQKKAPYLISMGTSDFNDYIIEDIDSYDEEDSSIPAPNGEPVIGVFDTQFSENVYFHEWVEYKCMLSPDVPMTARDYVHGTRVDSILVDGPTLNPFLDDGCGRFRVRHFGVALHRGFSTFNILRQIREIVAGNRDIKVWNLSLGSNLEIDESSISPEAAELDRIQNEYDVIFIIAGTNDFRKKREGVLRIGSPADSLNSIVVNSVNGDGEPASYTRVGPVLSFFNKPDVACYGGDISISKDFINTIDGNSFLSYPACGTSYAAPWITRKVAYLIYVMGLSREVAKALLIDSAAGWNSSFDFHKTGYGRVPIHINDILATKNDEIRFIITGAADSYETYTYNLPVPVVKDKHPFYARATMVYFPMCNRYQGVDYTNTELDIHFGRVNPSKKGKNKIVALNRNKQGDSGLHIIYEEDARNDYRKWDNVKHISEHLSKVKKPRKAYDAGMWGISVVVKERLSNKHKDPLPFGIVVTLKEMYGKNRIDEFKKLCMARGWLVNTLDIRNQVDIYEKSNEQLELF